MIASLSGFAAAPAVASTPRLHNQAALLQISSLAYCALRGHLTSLKCLIHGQLSGQCACDALPDNCPERLEFRYRNELDARVWNGLCGRMGGIGSFNRLAHEFSERRRLRVLGYLISRNPGTGGQRSPTKIRSDQLDIFFRSRPFHALLRGVLRTRRLGNRERP